MIENKTKSKTSVLAVTAAFGIWTLLGLFWATRLYFSYNEDTLVVPWSATMTWGLIDFYAWGALSPLVIFLARKFKIERESWIGPTLIHIPISVALALLQLLIFSGFFMLFGGLEYLMKSHPNPTLWSVWDAMLLGKLHSSIIIYWGILIAALGLDYHKRFRVEKLRASEIQTRLAQAELAALKMQLHPHFLFNTLNTIASLIREQPEEAEKTVVRLADLLRNSLRGSADNEITLREELSFIEKYLDIESIRFQDRLKVVLNIADETLDASTPALILQPLVENAVKHGIAPLESDGVLTLSSQLQNGSLVLCIADNGPGLPSGWEKASEKRIGLTNTRERLKQLYGDKQRFSIEKVEPTGARVTIEFPFVIHRKSENH